MIDRRWIGHRLEATQFTVERGRLRFFAQAIGETGPVYIDLEAARIAGHADLPAPPTFLFSAELDSGAIFSMLEMLGIDIGKILHGEQSFSYHKEVIAGDTLTVHSTITDICERKGGALQLVVKQSEVVNQRAETVARMRSVIVVKQ